MTKADLVDLVQQLGGDVQLLIQHSRSAEDVAAPAVARLALMTLELCQMRSALHLKEQQKKVARGRLFPGGRGVESTSDEFMNEQLLILNKREQEKVEEAQKRADNAAYKKIYAEAMAKWNERRQEFRLAGFPMTHAGKKPLLHEIKAGKYSITERNVYNEFHHSKYTTYLTTCFTTKCGDSRPGEVHLKIW